LEIMALRALGDRDSAQEAVQETLTRALEAIRDGRIRQPEKLAAFVRGIARNVISELQRDRQRLIELGTEPSSALVADPPNALDVLISEHEAEQVQRAVSEMTQSDQEILSLSFFEGLTAAEIAERLGEPAGRIRKRKSRALARLRRAFLG
jgi:RNA polymerase sigma-70 factor (ECF subfamily)